MPDQTQSPTPDPEVAAAADEFAAQVVKSALKPAPDGLNVLEELARAGPRRPAPTTHSDRHTKDQQG
jgi:hypothetical protein